MNKNKKKLKKKKKKKKKLNKVKYEIYENHENLELNIFSKTKLSPSVYSCNENVSEIFNIITVKIYIHTYM